MRLDQHIASFVKYNRAKVKMTQGELAERAGVGLRFIRDLEQGKETLRMDKVNQVLRLFGHILSAKPQRILDPYKILLHHFNKNVHVHLRNKTVLSGLLVDVIQEASQIKAWKFVPINNAIEYQKTKNPELVQVINHTEIENVENI